MNDLLNIIKGIQPGKFIEREINKRNINQRTLAHETNIPYQTINAIISGKRSITIDQASKLDKTLGHFDGFFALLQTHYEIKKHKDKELESIYSESPHIRKSLFWDVDFNNINWAKYKKAVIERVMERGNQEEKDEIKRYYSMP